MAKILSDSRAAVARVADPLARGLLRVGVTPDAVTVAGTLGVLVASGLAAFGYLLVATLVATVSALTYILDGSMARARGTSSRFGAFLDSSMDRVADGAIFASLAYWLFTSDEPGAAVAALLVLVTSQLISYVRARAEALGLTANVGLIERPERLIAIGVGGLCAGFGWPTGMYVVLWVLGILSLVTVGQRIVHVYRQAKAAESAESGAAEAAAE
jgi:CDP-diacylglycerol---glycerol-3-phosphate 3-phosphatidyltransferase